MGLFLFRVFCHFRWRSQRSVFRHFIQNWRPARLGVSALEGKSVLFNVAIHHLSPSPLYLSYYLPSARPTPVLTGQCTPLLYPPTLPADKEESRRRSSTDSQVEGRPSWAAAVDECPFLGWNFLVWRKLNRRERNSFFCHYLSVSYFPSLTAASSSSLFSCYISLPVEE